MISVHNICPVVQQSFALQSGYAAPLKKEKFYFLR